MAMLQIRNVPDDVHRRLKARAAIEGMTLSELALTELRRSLDRPTRRELMDVSRPAKLSRQPERTLQSRFAPSVDHVDRSRRLGRRGVAARPAEGR